MARHTGDLAPLRPSPPPPAVTSCWPAADGSGGGAAGTLLGVAASAPTSGRSPWLERSFGFGGDLMAAELATSDLDVPASELGAVVGGDLGEASAAIGGMVGTRRVHAPAEYCGAPHLFDNMPLRRTASLLMVGSSDVAGDARRLVVEPRLLGGGSRGAGCWVAQIACTKGV